MKLWFGAHEGDDLTEVPKNYLRWLIEKTERPRRIPEDTNERYKAKCGRWADLISEASDELEARA